MKLMPFTPNGYVVLKLKQEEHGWEMQFTETLFTLEEAKS
jgi:hypothetical protein